MTSKIQKLDFELIIVFIELEKQKIKIKFPYHTNIALFNEYIRRNFMKLKPN